MSNAEEFKIEKEYVFDGERYSVSDNGAILSPSHMVITIKRSTTLVSLIRGPAADLLKLVNESGTGDPEFYEKN